MILRSSTTGNTNIVWVDIFCGVSVWTWNLPHCVRRFIVVLSHCLQTQKTWLLNYDFPFSMWFALMLRVDIESSWIKFMKYWVGYFFLSLTQFQISIDFWISTHVSFKCEKTVFVWIYPSKAKNGFCFLSEFMQKMKYTWGWEIFI